MAVVFADIVPDDFQPIGQPTLAGKMFRTPLAKGIEIVIHAFTSNEPLARDSFDYFLVRPQHNAQQQFVELHQKGTRERLGFLFPLASLNPDAEYQNRWTGVFAHAAVECLLATQTAKKLLVVGRIEDIVTSEGISITDLFDPALGIVVIGKERMAKANCTLDTIRLMIQEHGIRLISPRTTEPQATALPTFESRLHIRQCSAHIIDEVGQFCLLLEIADQQRYLPARFLTLYQIVEALISQVFEHAVRTLVTDPMMQQDVWELRERLNEISNEKSRINKLFSSYMGPKMDELNLATEGLRTACLDFLQKADPGVATAPPVASAVPTTSATLDPAAVPVATIPVSKQDLSQKAWSDLLYRSRNLIVHRQWQIRSLPEHELADACLALERLCYLFLSGYSTDLEH
jgi:hypothetical protein